MLLEALVNEQFINDSIAYYDDLYTQKEIEDMELGLNGDLSRADLKHLVKDKDAGHGSRQLSFRFPDRFGSNYEKSDDLSIYKVMPRGQKPEV